MRIIQNDPKSAYLEAVERVLRNGYHVVDERGDSTKEVLNLHTTITNHLPTNVLSDNPKGSVWNKERLVTYCKQVCMDNNDGFVYTYGERLNYENQLESIVDRLNNCPESRRAVATTWQPIKDTKNEDVPCLMMVDFKIRDNLLYTTAVWRSHDIYGAYYPNLVGLYTLAKRIYFHLEGRNRDIDIGTIQVYSISAHINEHDFEDAEKLLQLNGVI